MLTVVVARPPRFGGKVASFDAAEALKVKGVVDVKQIGSGVAVYANGMWPALKGREALKVDLGRERRREARQPRADRRVPRARPHSRALVAGSHGDAEAALAKADKVIEAEFVFPYLAHAPMEPLDGYLQWDGSEALARFGSQFQTTEHQTIADHPRPAAGEGAGSRPCSPAAASAGARRSASISRPSSPWPPRRSARTARSSWSGPARTISPAATTARSSCIACAAR